MGYDLTNSAGQTHRWKVLGWWNLLNLARECGWSPSGTLLPPEADPDWDGNYFHNAGQSMTQQDSCGLADALERLLSDSNREAIAATVTDRMQRVMTDADSKASTDARDVLLYPIDFIRGMLGHFGQDSIGKWSFDPESEANLRQFIALCRAGPFMIE